MKNMQIFKNFLESVKTDQHSALIEAITQGIALIEADESGESEFHEKTLSFTFRNYENTMETLIGLYQDKHRGILILDPEADLEEPVTAFVIPQRKPGDSGVNRYLTYDVNITEPDEGKNRTCTITIKSNEKDTVDKTTDILKKLIEAVARLGNCGHYFEIRFVPINNRVKSTSMGWDGDGSDYIDTDSIQIS